MLDDGGAAHGHAGLLGGAAQAAAANFSDPHIKMLRVLGAQLLDQGSRVRDGKRRGGCAKLGEQALDERTATQHTLIEAPAFATTRQRAEPAPNQAAPQPTAAEVDRLGHTDAVGYEAPVAGPSVRLAAWVESREHRRAVLRGKAAVAEQDPMARPGVVLQRFERVDQACA